MIFEVVSLVWPRENSFLFEPRQYMYFLCKFLFSIFSLSEVMKTVVDDHDDLTKLEDHSKFKIEREYKELYDNEYTRASIEMQKLGLKLETQKMTQFFLDILKVCLYSVGVPA